uniref:Uncharacterized protein n=1 Tax=Chromera velia CCMP2878 TaxID=1169474 RepID=A0A0G4G246_9ALVE|eukprot:Cvel_19884.t1-p1 / transcript=Cvel_19884.t1 / gene=Cvel_19884 / organism=Chromera_velia_CCMP2878 / gene_product=hypothetical protein / transcript_product=hypothetical protein / location=Cvel_scaffold1745:6235-6924(+) / protein_length=230 / sequence_SO=supercontig / SO=protein_coding / is_pseudo=false
MLPRGVNALTNPDFESMSVKTARQLRQLSSNFASKYDKHFGLLGSRNQKEKEKGSREKREGSDGNGQRRQNGQSEKSHSESSSSSSSDNSFSLSESDVSRIAAQILQIQEKKQSEKEKKKEGKKLNRKKEKVCFSEERVRMANAFCGAELQELVRHGGGHIDIVFDYSEFPFALQDIPIYEAACATEEGGSEMTAVSLTSEENKDGGRNFDPFQDYPGEEAAFKARFAHC